MRGLRDKNCKCIVQIEEMILLFRRQNYYSASTIEQIVLNNLTELIDELCKREILDVKMMNSFLVPLLEAKQKQDYVLLADLYEVQILPFLLQLQQELKEVDRYSYWMENLSALKDEELKKRLQMESDLLSKIECRVEDTSVGAKTICVKKDGKEWYLHSNVNPWREAAIFAEEYYDVQQTEYFILGFGLGYHIEQLRKKSAYNKLTVFETDLNVLKQTFSGCDLRDMLSSEQVKIIYDPELKCLGKFLKVFDGVFAIHYPSLDLIDNEEIKERCEEYFMHLSSVKSQLTWMRQNFNENVKTIDKVVDELKAKWSGKEVLIAAGGPSLIENMDEIRQLRKDRILLAVGTVVKKLLQEGIRPDYMIITDAKEDMVKQIAGIKTDDIPLLYLSTVSPRVLREHKGEQYCVLQNGFQPAEVFARSVKADLYETGGSVSTTALDVAIRLANNTIYCFGLDLAYTDARTHAEGTADSEKVDVVGLKEVKAVHGGSVPTIKNLDSYRRWIERRISKEKNIQFINISRGAYIQGMENRVSL